jgi:hypothetical protein
VVQYNLHTKRVCTVCNKADGLQCKQGVRVYERVEDIQDIQDCNRDNKAKDTTNNDLGSPYSWRQSSRLSLGSLKKLVQSFAPLGVTDSCKTNLQLLPRRKSFFGVMRDTLDVGPHENGHDDGHHRDRDLPEPVDEVKP